MTEVRKRPSTAGPDEARSRLQLLRTPPARLPVGTRLLPPWHRRRVAVLYRFAALVRLATDENDPAGLIEALEEDLTGLHGRPRPRHPDIRQLRRLVHRRDLPTAPLHKLIAAARADVHCVRYARYEDLLEYAALSGAPVGELTVRALDGRVEPVVLSHVESLYTAARMLMLCRGVRAEAGRARIYLPQREMQAAGVSERVLQDGGWAHALDDIVRTQTLRALQQLRSERPVLRQLRPGARIAVSGMFAEAEALGQVLERRSAYRSAQPLTVPRRLRMRAFADALLRP